MGGRARTVGIEPAAGAIVERWLEARAQARAGLNNRHPLFCTLGGARMGDAYIRVLLPRLGRRAGIENRVHAHGLRHTHAAQLRVEGMDIGIISRQLGHRSIATTARYLNRTAPQQVIEATLQAALLCCEWRRFSSRGHLVQFGPPSSSRAAGVRRTSAQGAPAGAAHNGFLNRSHDVDHGSCPAWRLRKPRKCAPPRPGHIENSGEFWTPTGHFLLFWPRGAPPPKRRTPRTRGALRERPRWDSNPRITDLQSDGHHRFEAGIGGFRSAAAELTRRLRAAYPGLTRPPGHLTGHTWWPPLRARFHNTNARRLLIRVAVSTPGPSPARPSRLLRSTRRRPHQAESFPPAASY